MLALRRSVTCYESFCFPVGEDTISPWQARWIRTRSTEFKCSLLIYTVGNRLLDSLIVDKNPCAVVVYLAFPPDFGNRTNEKTKSTLRIESKLFGIQKKQQRHPLLQQVVQPDRIPQPPRHDLDVPLIRLPVPSDRLGVLHGL